MVNDQIHHYTLQHWVNPRLLYFRSSCPGEPRHWPSLDTTDSEIEPLSNHSLDSWSMVRLGIPIE